MNPTALITGNIAKGTTGALSRGVADPADPLTFKKHLMAGGGQEQKLTSGTVVASGFSGVLNSISNLINVVDQVNKSPELSQLLENGNLEGLMGEDKGLDQGEISEGVEVGVSDNAQANVVAVVITPEIPVSNPVAQNESEELLLAVPVQGAANASRGHVNINQAENIMVSTEMAAKAGKSDVAASQLIMPEIKRAVAVETKSATENLAAITGQSGVTKGQETLKVANIQQMGSLQNLLSEKDKPAFSLRTEGVPTAFASSVTTVLKETVTERQVSSSTSVIEKTVVEQLSNGMLKVSSREAGKVVIKLTPEHLGNVEVTLSKKNGQTMVRVVVDRSETLDIVRSDIRSLEKTLIESGVDVRSNSISLALKSSSDNTGSGDRPFNDNDRSYGQDISKAREVSDVPRKLIDGRGGILNIRV